MQLIRLFNLLHDAQDLLEFFDGVEDPNQMASRLNRLKQGDAPQDLADNVQALRLSLAEAFNDQIELGGLLTDDNSSEDPIADDLLGDFQEDDAAPTNNDAPKDVQASEALESEKTTT